MPSKKCPRGKIKSPKSKRCIKKCSPGYIRKRSRSPKRSGRCIKKCASGEKRSSKPRSRCKKVCERSKKTGRCMNPCSPGWYHSRSTNRCRKRKSSAKSVSVKMVNRNRKSATKKSGQKVQGKKASYKRSPSPVKMVNRNRKSATKKSGQKVQGKKAQIQHIERHQTRRYQNLPDEERFFMEEVYEDFKNGEIDQRQFYSIITSNDSDFVMDLKDSLFKGQIDLNEFIRLLYKHQIEYINPRPSQLAPIKAQESRNDLLSQIRSGKRLRRTPEHVRRQTNNAGPSFQMLRPVEQEEQEYFEEAEWD